MIKNIVFNTYNRNVPWIENGTLEIYIPEQHNQSKIVSIKFSDLVYAESQGARIIIVRFLSNEFWVSLEQIQAQGKHMADEYTLSISKWHPMNDYSASNTVYPNTLSKTEITKQLMVADSDLDDNSGGVK